MFGILSSVGDGTKFTVFAGRGSGTAEEYDMVRLRVGIGDSTPFLIAGVALGVSLTGPSEGFFFIADGRTCGVANGGIMSVVLELVRDKLFNGKAMDAATGLGFLPEDPPLRLAGRSGISRSLATPFERFGPSSCFIGTKVGCRVLLGLGREDPPPGSEK